MGPLKCLIKRTNSLEICWKNRKRDIKLREYSIYYNNEKNYCFSPENWHFYETTYNNFIKIENLEPETKYFFKVFETEFDVKSFPLENNFSTLPKCLSGITLYLNA